MGTAVASVSRSSAWAVPLLGATAGIAMADPSVASTALVEASRGLGISTGLLPFAASVENYMAAASVVSTGLLADRLGRRRVLVAAALLAVIAELLAAGSTVPVVFLIARALMGVAGGAIFGSAFAFVRHVAPDRLGSALGTFGAVATLTMMTLSLLGGTLASVSWRLGFVMLAASAALAAILVLRVLPPISPVGSGPADVTGQVLLALGVVLPLYGLSEATGPTLAFVLPVAAGAAALVGFFVVEHRGRHPFFPIAVFKDRRYLAALVLGLSFNAALAALLLQLANLWQYLDRWATWQVSLASMPAFLAGMAASVVAGRRLSRGVTPRTVAVTGMVLMALGFAALSTVRPGNGPWAFVAALLLVGLGTQAVNVPYGALVVQCAPEGGYGPVTSSRTTVGQIGYALGLAGSTVMIDRLTRQELPERLAEAGVSPTRTADAISTVLVYVEHGTRAATDEARQVLGAAAQAYVSAFSTTMLAMSGLLVVLGVIAWLLLAGTFSGAVDGADPGTSAAAATGDGGSG